MKFFFTLLLLSSSVFAGSWQDLEVLHSYKLNRDFQLRQTERSHALMDFSKGDEVVLKDILPLSNISVMVYVLKYVPCPGAALETELEMITPEVGAQLESGCELNLYVEVKDLLRASILE